MSNMSTDKGEAKTLEIDKSKRRQRTDDNIATAALNSEDILQCSKMGDLESAGKPTELCIQASTHLISSTTSSLADTPGDSGVQCLDSETSEAANQAMTHSLLGTEELVCDSQCEGASSMVKSTTSSLMTRSELDHHSIDDIVPELVGTHGKSPVYENLPDVVLKALESEHSSPTNSAKPHPNEPKKSLSEDIVYRRRCQKKSQNAPVAQKKRVSFHEDILNNTKTDNIHIERGFISYGPDRSYCDRFRQRNNIHTERFSWCASGDRNAKIETDVGQQTMSDILTYDSKNDRSGVFEYIPDYDDDNNDMTQKDKDNNNDAQPERKMYGCNSNSSDSNFSCDSESSSDSLSHSNKTQGLLLQNAISKEKTQKSYSCDGFDNRHMSYMKKTYFSEADIDQSHNKSEDHFDVSQSPKVIKSVLKKNRYVTTNVVEERNRNKRRLNLLDANNIIGSLKSFYKNFNFNFAPEKGLPESSLDLNNVTEALPDVNQNNNVSKSQDSGLHLTDDDDFVEINLNETQLDNQRPSKEMVASICSIAGEGTPKEGSPRHKLTLNMKSDRKANEADAFPAVNKYIVNCESTVYEHKGVSYSYVHDAFQTAFDAPKETFVPLPETTPLTPVQEMSSTRSELSSKLSDIDSSSKQSTPRRQFSKLQDEDLKSSKHLSSPKKQNINKLRTSSVQKNEDAQIHSETCSNSNSTLKNDDFPEDFFDSPAAQKLQSDKSALLNRYLKAVCQKKELEARIRSNKFLQKKILEKHFPSIIYPFKNVARTFPVSAHRMSRLIDKEVIENKRLSVRLLTANEPSYFDSFEDNVAVECSEKLRLQIFSYPDETLHRMMKVQSPPEPAGGAWSPQLVFVTDYALYLAEVEPAASEYQILCRLPHDRLDAIAMGPEAQYVQVIDTAGNVACSVVTGDASLGARLASSLEWCARTSPLRPARPPALLALKSDQLAVAVARQRMEKKVPQVLYYGRACSGDAADRLSDAEGAFAPPLEGYLMCRTEGSRRFEPYYFLLRAGVLHWGSSPPSAEAPPHRIPLRSVLGVRRLAHASRPHCFELASRDRRLLLAAAGEGVASAWLQSLLLHAAQALEEHAAPPPRALAPPACTVLVTRAEVLAVRESLDASFVAGAAAYYRDRGDDALLKEYARSARGGAEVLACGALRDLTAFKIPDTDGSWCCLEWSVCEARERGAALALVFASGAELERFIAAVERAYTACTSEPFPLSVVEAANSACATAHAAFDAAWAHMLPSHQ